MEIKRIAGTAAAGLGLAIVVTACGGGSGTSSGTDGTGTASTKEGRVSGFGSVIVDGTRYEVGSGTTISLDDRAGTQQDLDVGMRVTVKGSSAVNGGTPTASAIRYDDELEGPISSIDPVAGSLIAMGQTVLVTLETVFDDSAGTVTGLGDLAEGNIVEVSGTIDAQGRIVASRIERKATSFTAANQFEAKGTIQTLNTTAQTFAINDLIVNYSSAALDDIPDGTLQNGQFVEARGTLNEANELVANEVENEIEGIDAAEGEEVELSGLITETGLLAETLPGLFQVGRQPVAVDDLTVFEDGGVLDLVTNRRVEIEGVMGADGTVQAREISFEEESNLIVESTVASIDNARGTLTTNLGVTSRITPATITEDDSEAELQTFRLGDLGVGDRVELIGSPSDGGTMVARRMTRQDPEPGCTVRGVVTNVSNPNLGVLGINVATNSQTQFEVDGQAVSSSSFFSTVVAGDTIEAETESSANCVNGQFTPDTVSLED